MTADELRTRAAQMKEANERGEPRRAIELWPRSRGDESDEEKAAREHVDVAKAVAIRKDKTRRVLERLNEARDLVAPYLEKSVTPDTFGIMGGIVRRFYEIDLREDHLVTALRHYRRGHQLDAEQGWPALGYPGINVAFLTDQLAALESDGHLAQRSEVADGIRRTLIDVLPAKVAPGEPGYWTLATIAEAHFGLRQYDLARPFLEEASKRQPAGWMRKTTGEQLAHLARLQEGKIIPKAAVDAVGVLFEGRTDGLWSAVIGKLGLALSGGGFRASLFHIGVLARLAELDLLRHVEVISCVSGGSILGALYYLELRRALDNPEVNYVEVVAQVRKRFLKGLRLDLRNRIFFDVRENWQMLSGRRSRSEVAAKLYERSFYSGYEQGNALELRKLGVGATKENYWRHHKRPKLILNAATLNTGHAWQFTVDEMGEPPPVLAEDLDVNDRFERQPYSAFGAPACDVRLGTAVAASACVPGIFAPIELKDAYPAHQLRLVDGGVHDNQGVRALLDQDCTAILVSDASGQMGFEEQSPIDALGTVLRTNAIFQARIREAQYADLRSRRRGNLLRYLRLVHMKQDFQPRTVMPGQAGPAAKQQQLGYGFSSEVQQRLAQLRTDLDTFSEVECELLMASGYAMAREHIRSEDLGAPPPERIAASPAMSGLKLAAPGDVFRKGGWEAMLRHLDVGASVMGKSIQSSPWVKRSAQALGFLVAGAVVWWLNGHWNQPVTQMTAGAVMVAVGTLLFKRAVPLAGSVIDLKHGELPGWHVIKRGLMAVAMALGARGASWLVRRTFLRRGRVKEFTR